MPTNIEIKAKVSDVEQLRTLAKDLSGSLGHSIEQEDTFYVVPSGRLKLRKSIGEESSCRLFFYEREDIPGPKQSDYHAVEVDDPLQMNLVLSLALGVLGVVNKKRTLYMVGQTRIHLDMVEDLGNFMELEVMLNEGQTKADGEKVAEDLMTKLCIRKEDLIDCAYIDLILKQLHNPTYYS